VERVLRLYRERYRGFNVRHFYEMATSGGSRRSGGRWRASAWTDPAAHTSFGPAAQNDGRPTAPTGVTLAKADTSRVKRNRTARGNRVCRTKQTRAWGRRNLQSREASIVWYVAIGLAFGVLGISAFVPREWRAAYHSDLGWMSHQWLAEHRAGSR